MQLDADPRCTRGTSSEPVLTLRTGRKDCELCVIYLRARRSAPIFYTLAGFRLSRRGRRRQLKSVARISIFCTGGVGTFGTFGFTGTMDNIPPHLALPGELQRGQAADHR